MNNEEIIHHIIKIFSHYSKEQKLAICRFLSYCSTFPFGKYTQFSAGTNDIMPWRSETIITIILMNLESNSLPAKYFPSEEFDNDINEIMTIFNDYEKPPYTDEHVSLYGLHGMLGPLFIKQLTYQRYIYTKLYRFNYIFTSDNYMKAFFKRKTGLDDYFVYAFLGEIQTAFIELHHNKKDIFSFVRYQLFMDEIYNTYQDGLGPLLCDINRIKPTQSKSCNINHFNELTFSYKCLCERPLLVKDGNIFPIALHCMDFACTEGLLLNITASEKEIIDHIGPILEKYMYHLLDESGLFSLPSLKRRKRHYKVKNKDKEPSDAIAKNGETILIFECKEKIFKRKIFINDLATLKEEYSYAAGAVKQLLDYYNHLKNGYYNPFQDNTDKDKEVYLILVKLFYVPINIESVINEVAQDPEYSRFKDYLTTHLLITDFDTLELFFLHRKDFTKALEAASKNNELHSFAKYRPSCDAKSRTASFANFMDKLRKSEEEQISIAAHKISSNYRRN